ncbi:MAG: hypothetical protein AMJ79_00505, partial [Phycisphaerae bacterium SM23_30]
MECSTSLIFVLSLLTFIICIFVLAKISYLHKTLKNIKDELSWQRRLVPPPKRVKPVEKPIPP